MWKKYFTLFTDVLFIDKFIKKIIHFVLTQNISKNWYLLPPDTPLFWIPDLLAIKNSM